MLEVVLPEKSYEIIIERNALDHVSEWIEGIWKNKKIAIISDTNVFSDIRRKNLSTVAGKLRSRPLCCSSWGE